MKHLSLCSAVTIRACAASMTPLNTSLKEFIIIKDN